MMVMVQGYRCAACRYPVVHRLPRCPLCAGALGPAEFGPLATVWSATVTRVSIPGTEPPFGLAYVDLDDGPRILARFASVAPAVGARVSIAAVEDTIVTIEPVGVP